MKTWEKRAVELLGKSLFPVPVELNQLDWKSDLSDDSDKLCKHLSAFSHLPEGGFLVFGISDDGNFCPLSKNKMDAIIKKLSNLANTSLSHPISLDHLICNYNGNVVLFVFIPESDFKPVHLKNDIYSSYKRIVGNSVKMAAKEVKYLIAQSLFISFEEQIALNNIEADDVLLKLDYPSYFRLIGKVLPPNKSAILDALVLEDIIKQLNETTYNITNLGAISFANKIAEFKSLKRKAVRVISYTGTNKIEAKKEQEGVKGYATSFENLIRYVQSLLPANEIIVSALRQEVKIYPEVALREFIANALIHQDFSISGAGVMIEIFADRIEITNPGIPLIETNRFIGAVPKSRNEALASFFRRLHICEERGSGVIRAIAQIEVFQLPAPKFVSGEDYTKVIIYSHKTWSQMDKEDRIRACYQHCCLQYVSSQNTTNQSVRARFNISEANYPMASRVIADTLETKLIKQSDPNSNSRKHASYIPFWA